MDVFLWIVLIIFSAMIFFGGEIENILNAVADRIRNGGKKDDN